MRLTNISPVGSVDITAIGRRVARGESFDVDDDLGARLLEQPANFAQTEQREPPPDDDTTQE